MKTVKVDIGMASLADIAEKACKVYRRELAEAEFLSDIQCIVDSLVDVMRLWEAAYDNFDCDDKLILTIERREVQEDGTDHAD